jgi:hypothetical protein
VSAKLPLTVGLGDVAALKNFRPNQCPIGKQMMNNNKSKIEIQMPEQMLNSELKDATTSVKPPYCQTPCNMQCKSCGASKFELL